MGLRGGVELEYNQSYASETGRGDAFGKKIAYFERSELERINLEDV